MIKFKPFNLLVYLLLAVGAFFAILPFLWMISTSLMSLGETINKQLIPSQPVSQGVENYQAAWTEGEFSKYFFNSVLITFTTLAGMLLTCVLAAYAFARIQFPGRNILFALLLATMMIPEAVTVIPLIKIIRGEIQLSLGFIFLLFALLGYGIMLWRSRVADYGRNILLGLFSLIALLPFVLKIVPQIQASGFPSSTFLIAKVVLVAIASYLYWQARGKPSIVKASVWLSLVVAIFAIDLAQIIPLASDEGESLHLSNWSMNFLPFGPSWMNTLQGLTVPFMASIFNIFLLRQAFAKVPNELWDAARIDGTGHFRFLWQIMLPINMPVMLTVTLFSFIGAWNAFMWPLLVTTTPRFRPLMVGLWNFVTEAGAETQLLMAASVITIVPILIVFFFTQKYFTEGIASSGLKG